MNERILVTGATGFIGHLFTQRALEQGYRVRVVLRRPEDARKFSWARDVEIIQIDDIGQVEDRPRVFDGVFGLVHLAGMAHVAEERDPLSARRYFDTNTLGTVCLASGAARAGVTRFVFVSSIKVNGRSTPPGDAFSETDQVQPRGPYALSKWEGEQRLWRVAADTGLEAVVVRPPVVYGPGVKANLLALLRVVDKDLPLPLGSIHNRRSFIGVSNLADLLAACLGHPAAAGETFLAADGEDLSTPDLVRALAKSLDRPCRLLPFPPFLLKAASSVRSDVGGALLESLAVDAGKARRTLAWSPSVPLTVGLAEMADWYLAGREETGRA